MEFLKLEKPATSSQIDDIIIVGRILCGEKKLFEVLLRRYNQTLFRVIRSYLKDPDEIQDAMQNTYLKAYDKLYQFQGQSAFSTWLIRIGINEALLRLNNIKKERNLYAASVGATADTILQMPDRQMNPEKSVMREETQYIIEHAIDRMPEKYRAVFVLKEIEGLKNREIAESLEITESNVKVRLHRAKMIMKDALCVLSPETEVFGFGDRHCDAVVNFVVKRI